MEFYVAGSPLISNGKLSKNMKPAKVYSVGKEKILVFGKWKRFLRCNSI